MTDTAAPGVHTGTGPARRAALSDRLPRPWLFPLLVFAADWVLIVATWNIANAIYGTAWSWNKYFWFKDSGFYITIAMHGYAPASQAPPPLHVPLTAAFFPVLPVLARVMLFVTANHLLEAGLIAAIVAGAASAVAVWALAARVYDHRVADRAVLLYCAFPGAMTFGLLYTEPLAIALAATCLIAVLDRRWLLAGLLALVGSAEASTLIVLTAVLGVAALHAIWTRREWRSLIAPVLAPLGMLAYFAYNGSRYHDYLFWFRMMRRYWGQRIDWGAHELSVLMWINPAVSKSPIFFAVVAAMFWVAVIGIGLLIAARAPWPVTLYSTLVILVAVVSYEVLTRPRFVLLAFGIFIGAAAKLPRWVFWPVLIISAAMLAFLVGWWPHNGDSWSP